MTVAALIVGVGAALATLGGGTIAVRFRSRLSSYLAVSSGTVLGVALLDLLPEALRLGSPTYAMSSITAAVASGLFTYLLLDALLSGSSGHAASMQAGLGPASLVAHSLIDGLAMGLAFHLSAVTGTVVAIAVLVHDLFDGANTVVLGLAGGTPSSAHRWLIADAAAPLAGILLAGLVVISPPSLGLLLGFFAGGFLYIGAIELLPRVRGRSRSVPDILALGLGLFLIRVIVTPNG